MHHSISDVRHSNFVELSTNLNILIFNARFETSATILSYSLYELAKNERILEEVDEVMVTHDNRLNYECISAAVVEAQRLYPFLGVGIFG